MLADNPNNDNAKFQLENWGNAIGINWKGDWEQKINAFGNDHAPGNKVGLWEYSHGADNEKWTVGTK